MKKILFMGGLNSGGAEHQMAIIASALSLKGYDVTYLYGEGPEFFKPLLADTNVKLVKIKDNRLSSALKLDLIRLSLCIYKLMKEEHFDTVISFLGLWNYVNCLFSKCKRTKHKAITGLRNCRDSVWLSQKNKFYTRFERFADIKVCNSDNAKELFGNYYPELKRKLITIYNAVSLPKISSTYDVRREGKTNIIIPASYRDVKNPFGFLNALSLLEESIKSKIHITWYGKISEGKVVFEEMLTQIDKLNMGKLIELEDATTDIANRIYESDVVGLFSKSEGLPNAICEGMLLGKPIVMTRVSDYDVLVDKSNGVLCDWDKIESISEALTIIASLTENEILRMGCNSKAKAEMLFGEDSIIKKWEEIV